MVNSERHPSQTAFAVPLLMSWCAITAAVDKGFELHFTTQPDRISQRPVNFERPLPSWIKGTLTRNGLGRFEVGPRRFKHAFDGFAKLSSWTFLAPNTTLFYTDFVQTSFYEASIKKNNIAPYLMFDSPIPPFSWLERMQALFKGIDNTNINVNRLGSASNTTYVAMSDFWQAYSFDPLTMCTTGFVNADVPGGSPFGSTLPLPSTAHPLPEYGSPDLISFVSLMNPIPLAESYIRLIRIKAANVRERIVDIPVPDVPYMHSFALSQNFAVLMGSPLYVNVGRMMATSNPVESLDWKPEDGLSLYVVNIRNQNYFRVKTDAMFPMHFINSYETENMLYVDFVVYPDIHFIKSLVIDVLMDPVKRNDIKLDCSLKRFAIDLQNETVSVTNMSLTPGMDFVNKMDMPAINEHYLHQKYCYVYGLTLKADDVHTANVSLVKKDVCGTGGDLAWLREDHYPSEPVFIPNPRRRSEDHGVLLSLVIDGRKRRSYLAVLDARTMKLKNRSYLPIHVPYSLHGKFFPAI